MCTITMIISSSSSVISSSNIIIGQAELLERDEVVGASKIISGIIVVFRICIFECNIENKIRNNIVLLYYVVHE